MPFWTVSDKQVHSGEIGGIGRAGPQTNVVRGPELSDGSVLDHVDLICKEKGVARVMGDQEARSFETVEMFFQCSPQLRPRADVKSRERFVEEQKIGLGHEGAGQSDSLRLSTRELSWLASA